MAQYSKFIAAVAGFLALVAQVLADGSVTSLEWGELATGAATAAAVFRLKNAKP